MDDLKNNVVVVLGAGSPHSELPVLEAPEDSDLNSVTEWLLRSVSTLDPEIHFVTGFDNAEYLRLRQSEIQFWRNEDWANTGAAWSLLRVPLFASQIIGKVEQNLFVTYSDIVFREEVIAKLSHTECDVMVAIDTKWKSRYAGRSDSDLIRCEKVSVYSDNVTRLGSDIDLFKASAEFVGVARFGPAAIKKINDLAQTNRDLFRHAKMSDLIELLRISGLEVKAVDLDGDWAELNDSNDLAKFVLGTKAQTLSRLKNVLKNGRIEKQVSFSLKDWHADSDKIVRRIQKQFSPGLVIVRSSALSEDTFSTSMAGAFDSILNVDSTNTEVLIETIEKVKNSYSFKNLADEILVQPMITDVLVSGVVFTRTLMNAAPYIVINYDDESGSTDSVTSGSKSEQNTIYLLRSKALSSTNTPKRFIQLLKCVQEIEVLLNYDALDIEFAISEKFGLHILQVRPMVVGSEVLTSDFEVQNALDIAHDTFIDKQSSPPWVKGSRTIFGVMPDWNPAEIIGKRPSPLALSLYNELVCDDVWATQRAEFGYRDVRPHNLLVTFGGHPYVDVRASLNSFVPAKISEEIAEKLVSFSLNALEKEPSLHDKIEFEIIPTCLALDLDRWQKLLVENANFSEDDCEKLWTALRDITIDGMSRVDSDLTKIDILESRFYQLREAELPILDKAFALLDDAKRLGTLPFAHLARNGFVAMSLLKSAVATGVISNSEKEDFLSSISTVSHALTNDAIRCREGEISWADFVDIYGHLRPGTYDLKSPTYRDDPEQYLRPVLQSAKIKSKYHSRSDERWGQARFKMASAMADLGLPGDVELIEQFLRSSIQGREYAKFIFSRNLSLALDLFSSWGELKGLSRDDLSMLDLNDFKKFRNGAEPYAGGSESWLECHLRDKIKQGLSRRNLTTAIELPALICKPADMYIFEHSKNTPNFVGSTKIIARVIEINTAHLSLDVNGCIAIIPSADPGYDWLFSQGISGLVTMYGGANSHMAIRAAEFDLPSAIGVGASLYKNISMAQSILLDPRNQTLSIVS